MENKYIGFHRSLTATWLRMNNAIDEVKNRADIVIGSNDEDGIAAFIEEKLLIAGIGKEL